MFSKSQAPTINVTDSTGFYFLSPVVDQTKIGPSVLIPQ